VPGFSIVFAAKVNTGGLFYHAALEHFSCCRESLDRGSAAFSLGKTPIEAAAPRYTYRKNALAAEGFFLLVIPEGNPRLPESTRLHLEENRLRAFFLLL